mmetsp:Transcript_39039/g.105684  ORF Transcript_39039/g.105684 Transcript_39039/m.105684 type:complete len:264 (-) Transcript_39039:73-864(-)|eukprot:CAMPEP_0171190772 /NCGR_PEP_ID=MMETSP0790-20130122/19025_1 /TAXON_ID=2925 /ORGANISM="Alexandrium catenella, Strain OF101" /LENGTH=263 /DNA_ID=CAMNT_0011655907 /DNA_START=90 /DNA_END=881 /DNA_ORIENTATION=-
MAGQPVANPLSNLGPKPRMMGAAGDQGLEFYSSGSMQPGSFPNPGAPVQPQQPQGGVAPPSMQPGTGFGGPMQSNVFTPQPQQQMPSYDDDIENEPPLLEELGIDVGNIWLRMKGIAFFKKLDEEVLRDADLGGPIVIILALGLCLLLAGKLVLGLLYGWGLTSCIFICLLINVMSQRGGIDLYCTTSILGYGLIPVVLLAFIGIFVSLKSSFGTVISAICIFWATATSSRFFATAIAMHQQRWLVAYPVGLVYTLVSLITVF